MEDISITLHKNKDNTISHKIIFYILHETPSYCFCYDFPFRNKKCRIYINIYREYLFDKHRNSSFIRVKKCTSDENVDYIITMFDNLKIEYDDNNKEYFSIFSKPKPRDMDKRTLVFNHFDEFNETLNREIKLIPVEPFKRLMINFEGL